MEQDYKVAVATNIAKTWRDKYGYVPASEMPEIVAKWEMFKRYGRDITKDESPEPVFIQRIEQKFGEWI